MCLGFSDSINIYHYFRKILYYECVVYITGRSYRVKDYYDDSER